jgi:hypothetical protein
MKADARRIKVKAGYIQMKPDVWYALQHDIEITECCGCGLVHRTYWKVERGRIYWRAAVDQRLTNKARRRDGVIVLKTKLSRPRGAASDHHSLHH